MTVDQQTDVVIVFGLDVFAQLRLESYELGKELLLLNIGAAAKVYTPSNSGADLALNHLQ